MTQYKCDYCSYKGDKEEMRGHLLGSHEINTFQGGLREHSSEVNEQLTADVPLNEFSGDGYEKDEDPFNEDDEDESVQVETDRLEGHPDRDEDNGILSRVTGFISELFK